MKKYILVAATALFMVGCQKPPAGGNLGVLKAGHTEDSWSNITIEPGSGHSGGAANTPSETVDVEVNGMKMKGNKGGLEESMAAFLSKDGYKNAADDAALKDQWYNFDQVNFEMASSTKVMAGSEAQIKNLAAILKAYPEAKIKIGGYTDKIGDEAANLKLSKERAEYIKAQLTNMGVGAQILGTEGYGSSFAKVAADASDAERSADRKMAVRFAK